MDKIDLMALGIRNPICYIHNTGDQILIDKFVKETRDTKRVIQGKEQGIPCHIINCFCMWSDYIPLTLDEWIEINERRRLAE